MPIAFYYLSGSPFSWKVWLSLERKQIPYDLHVLSADAGDLNNPEFLSINPRGRVPVIVDDGFALRESSAIVEYLEDRYPNSGDPLWPHEARARALARNVAIEGDSFIYPNVRKLVQELIMRKDGRPDEAAIAEAKAALARELPLLEGSLEDRFVAGLEPSAADFALYPFLAVLKRVIVRRPEYKIDGLVPVAVQHWMERVEALPYFTKTIPPHWKTS